jgi:hypothetical protein
MRIVLVTVNLLLLVSISLAKTYYVSVSRGDDKNPGDIENPFRTVQKAADLMVAGDTCFVREGVIRETIKLTKSGTVDKPICFVARPNETVTFSGTEVIDANWVGYFDVDRTWSTEGEKAFQSQGIGGRVEYSALFVDGKEMVKVNGPEELNSAGKWFVTFRSNDTRLVLWPPEEESVEGLESGYNNPLDHDIEGKLRDYAFEGGNVNNIIIRGFKFFAVTNSLQNCQGCVID